MVKSTYKEIRGLYEITKVEYFVNNLLLEDLKYGIIDKMSIYGKYSKRRIIDIKKTAGKHNASCNRTYLGLSICSTE